METVLESLELPKDLYKELKLLALQQKTTIGEIIIDGAKEEIAKYKAARNHVKKHLDKYKPMREQVREQVNKYKFSEIYFDREKVIEKIKDLHKQGLGYRRIAAYLNAEGVPTFSGRGQWHSSTVGRLIK